MTEKVRERIEKAIRENATSLDLGYCWLTEIPDEVFKLDQLTHLDISDNQLGEAGAQAIGKLDQLTHLYISNNQLGEAGAQAIGKLDQLTRLEISYNRLGEAGAQAIGKLGQLIHLEIRSNQLGEAGAQAIGKLGQLTHLDIRYNQLGEAGVQAIGKLDQLTHLDICSNRLGEAGAQAIGKLDQLTHLEISYNRLGEAGAQAIGKLDQLTHLDIRYNQLRDAGAQAIGKLDQLTHLEISDNQLGEAGAQAIGKLDQLTHLDIRYNRLGEAGAQAIGKLGQLTHLEISDNQLGEAGAQAIGKLDQLTHLYISNNQLRDAGARAIGKLDQLTHLDISDNQLGEAGAQAIGKLGQLTRLDISNNLIQHAHSLKRLEKLHLLSIKSNPIRDVPESIFETGGNCINDLRMWWNETEDSEKVKPNELVKLQIIGNGNAGKSSLLGALEHGECSEELKTTHGIVIKPLIYKCNDEKVSFQAWDFGGQEIYHGTHKLFIASQSLHLLVSENESEQWALDGVEVEDRQNKDEKVLHQPIQHYLEMSKRKSPKSIRWMVQNKIDCSRKELKESLEVIAKKNDIPFMAVSATKGTGVENLREALAIGRKDILHFGMLMPISWLEVQDYFLKNLQKRDAVRVKLIEDDQFNDICIRFDVSQYSRSALLDFLHYTGLVYHNKEFLKDLIIVDQKWALDAIYRPLDRSSDFYKELRDTLNGVVRVKELFRAFGSGYEESQKWLFLQFMKSCNLCFPIYRKDHKETENSYYVFPEFLPKEETFSIKTLWQNANEVRTFSYRPEYLDYFRVQEFIIALGNKTKIEHLWRNGLLVETEIGMFRVEADTSKSVLTIHIESYAMKAYLWLIISMLQESYHRKEENVWFNEDATPLELETLERQHVGLRQQDDEDGTADPSVVHDRDSGGESGSLKSILQDKEQPDLVRIVVSYASEDLVALEDLEEALSAFYGRIQLLFDRKIVDGKRYFDDQIKETFEDADCYIILVSPKYQNKRKKDYIWEKEFPIIKRRHEELAVPVFCFAVRPVIYVEDLACFASFRKGNIPLPSKGHERDHYLLDFAMEIIEGIVLADR